MFGYSRTNWLQYQMPLQSQNMVLDCFSEWGMLLCPGQNYISLDAITQVILVENSAGVAAIPRVFNLALPH